TMAVDKAVDIKVASLRPAGGMRAALVPALCVAALLGACAGVPEPNERLIAAQNALDRARADPARAGRGPTGLGRAEAAVARAGPGRGEAGDGAEGVPQAILARRQADLRTATAQRGGTERALDQAARGRDAIQLEASRRRTDSAQAQATTAQMQAEQERQRA